MWNKRSAPQLLPTGYVAPISRKKLPMDPHERPVVTEDNKVAVRAGSTGNHVRYVLIAGGLATELAPSSNELAQNSGTRQRSIPYQALTTHRFLY
jgi:hypothetical protein